MPGFSFLQETEDLTCKELLRIINLFKDNIKLSL